jgi:hypothetical protein
MIAASVKLPSHRFNYWTDPIGRHKPCVLIVGAGLSMGLAPLPGKLVNELIPKQEAIEKNLGIQTDFPLNEKEPQTLYQWADRCIAEIKLQTNDAEQAKLKFISAIGLMNDERFAAKANVPARGATPRHRIIARLAREGCIENVWSINWDLWLEAAFDCVGMTSVQYHSGYGVLPQCWKTQYETWVPPNPPQGGKQTVTLFKPHGCIGDLHRGGKVLLITESELGEPFGDSLNQTVTRMKKDLTANALCVMGWSASEPYLQTIFQDLKAANCLSGSLAIIDPYPKIGPAEFGNTHALLIDAYGKTNSDAICKVESENFGTTDDLMLWIQLQRGLNALKAACSSQQCIVQLLDSHLQTLESPVPNSFALGWVSSWFDTFLPVWLRLCFNCKAETFMAAGAVVHPDCLPLRLRDAHIPWGDLDKIRNDLISAALIYMQLAQIEPQDTAQLPWDFESYPGAFWHIEERHLLIPVPIWAEEKCISLAVLKPLMESRQWGDKGRIRALSVLPITYDNEGQCRINDQAAQLSRWRQELSGLMPHAQFASEKSIGVASLSDLNHRSTVKQAA